MSVDVFWILAEAVTSTDRKQGTFSESAAEEVAREKTAGANANPKHRQHGTCTSQGGLRASTRTASPEGPPQHARSCALSSLMGTGKGAEPARGRAWEWARALAEVSYKPRNGCGKGRGP